jgi:hypothetical protein
MEADPCGKPESVRWQAAARTECAPYLAEILMMNL